MSRLDDINFIKSLDKSDMHHLITHMPEQIYFSKKLGVPDCFTSLPMTPEKIPSSVAICGMGGSAIAGDIANILFGDQIAIKVVKDYRLPNITENTLCMIISYSGNTAETIECLRQAMSQTENVVAITSGGKIKEIIKGKCPCIDLPSGFPPRAAIGYLFFSILNILEFYRIVPENTKEVNKLIGNLMQKAGPLCFKTETEMNLAKSSAETIFSKTPIIYSSNHTLFPVAYRWKCQINENAKLPAFCNSFPETYHNEIEAWDTVVFAERFIPIFLRSFNDKKEYSNMIRVFQSVLEKKNIDYLEFYGDATYMNLPMHPAVKIEQPLMSTSVLIDIFSLIYLGDMISFYLAILNNVDPTEIPNIEYLKKQLNDTQAESSRPCATKNKKLS